MATNSYDRYQTVNDFRTAIRNYLRHAESIGLYNRAEADLALAIDEQEYQLFNKSAFILDEAIELWSENKKAQSLRHEVEQTHAQCAHNKGDLDLCQEILEQATYFQHLTQ